jgi:hypothetical protein
LPAINGQVAAHASVGQELQRMAQQAQSQEYRRDLVELVSQANPAAEATGVRPGREPLARAGLKGKARPKARPKGKAPGQPSLALGGAAEEAGLPLISVRA